MMQLQTTVSRAGRFQKVLTVLSAAVMFVTVLAAGAQAELVRPHSEPAQGVNPAPVVPPKPAPTPSSGASGGGSVPQSNGPVGLPADGSGTPGYNPAEALTSNPEDDPVPPGQLPPDQIAGTWNMAYYNALFDALINRAEGNRIMEEYSWDLVGQAREALNGAIPLTDRHVIGQIRRRSILDPIINFVWEYRADSHMLDGYLPPDPEGPTTFFGEDESLNWGRTPLGDPEPEGPPVTLPGPFDFVVGVLRQAVGSPPAPSCPKDGPEDGKPLSCRN